ncbi:MAG: DUF1338 domain-containing protein [Bacteroidetes bacterium]|nr:DUF1338 domain-containing protein [Bacteroidota bacterium]
MSNPGVDQLLEFFWRDYSSITPAAAEICNLLAARGERYVNDHIAFRTFNLDPIGVDSLGATFTRLGYTESGEYHFEKKRLFARSFAPPAEELPHVFISELITQDFSPQLQRIVRGLVEQIPASLKNSSELFTRIPSWKPVAYADYRRLLEESEYAGWLSAFGIRANHFTVLLNALSTFNSIGEFNAWLVANGYTLNASGGEVKGTPEELLEQSSIMANRVGWEFAGGEMHVIPTCYHEFARRYEDPATGRLYQGFIAKSADRIFESTDTGVAA